MARYRYKRFYEWNTDLAYIVGLIVTDGCLLNDGRHIDFTSKDLQLAQVFRDIVKPDAKIGTKSSGLRQGYFRVQLGNVALYDFLITCGLTINKSRTIKAVNVPDGFFADFLRGCFDGDGSIYSYWDKRWKNSLMFYTSFTSASLPFLIWLQNKINIQLPNIKGHIRKSGDRVWQLCYAKDGSRSLYKFMYYNEDAPYLVRKRKRYIEIFTLDPYAKL